MEKLKVLKGQYETLARQYKLPGFKELNEEFEIEKIAEKETELLLRQVRRCILEKIVAVSRFFELMLNPTEANLMILSMLKEVNAETKKRMEKIYRELSYIEITAVELDLDYSEKNEAKFILNVTKDWKKLKEALKDISKQLEMKLNVKDKLFNDYFG
jgi:uncharacterized ferritin-like protein (DUF455 family)